jgi:hypothetical protein
MSILRLKKQGMNFPNGMYTQKVHSTYDLVNYVRYNQN